MSHSAMRSKFMALFQYLSIAVGTVLQKYDNNSFVIRKLKDREL